MDLMPFLLPYSLAPIRRKVNDPRQAGGPHIPRFLDVDRCGPRTFGVHGPSRDELAGK